MKYTCEVGPTLCVLCGKNITREDRRHFRWTDEDQVRRGVQGCHMYDTDNGHNYDDESGEDEESEGDEE